MLSKGGYQQVPKTDGETGDDGKKMEGEENILCIHKCAQVSYK